MISDVTQTGHSKMLSFAEAAEYLLERYGIVVKPSTIAKWHREGDLRTFKSGRIVGIPPESLDQVVASKTRKGHS